MTKFYDDDCSFEHVTCCRFLKLYISVFEKWLSVTAMADGGEQMRSAHACDVSLGARIHFRHGVFIFHKPNSCSLMDNYFRHQTPCGIRKLTATFVSKIWVFSRFSWLLDFGVKMAEFPLPVLQIWRSRKWVAFQIQLMNIPVSECKYYCLQLVPKFGDVRDRKNCRLHPTGKDRSQNDSFAGPQE